MKQLKSRLSILFLFPLYIGAQTPVGTISDPETLLGPKSAGRAGATGSSELYHDSLVQNPAGSAFQSQYAISAAYLGAGDALTASIVDTKSGPVGGGAYYLRRNLKMASAKNPLLGSLPVTEERAGVSAMGRVSPQFGVGIGGKWAYRRSYTSALGNGKNINMDAGLRYAVTQTVVAGLLGQNLLSDDEGLNLRSFQFSLEWQAQANVLISGQVIKVVKPETGTLLTLPKSDDLVNWSIGGQYGWETFRVRAGYAQKNSWDQNLFTLGLGYESPAFHLDYAFEKQLKHEKEMLHRVGLTGFM